jgi:hypothetical protein
MAEFCRPHRNGHDGMVKISYHIDVASNATPHFVVGPQPRVATASPASKSVATVAVLQPNPGKATTPEYVQITALVTAAVGLIVLVMRYWKWRASTRGVRSSVFGNLRYFEALLAIDHARGLVRKNYQDDLAERFENVLSSWKQPAVHESFSPRQRDAVGVVVAKGRFYLDACTVIKSPIDRLNAAHSTWRAVKKACRELESSYDPTRLLIEMTDGPSTECEQCNPTGTGRVGSPPTGAESMGLTNGPPVDSPSPTGSRAAQPLDAPKMLVELRIGERGPSGYGLLGRIRNVGEQCARDIRLRLPKVPKHRIDELKAGEERVLRYPYPTQLGDGLGGDIRQRAVVEFSGDSARYRQVGDVRLPVHPGSTIREYHLDGVEPPLIIDDYSFEV